METKSRVAAIHSTVIFLLILLFALKFFGNTDREVIYTTNLLDGGWMYAMSRLPQLELSAGRDVFFTYGPLANKLPWTIIPGDIEEQVLIHKQFMATVFFISVFYLWLTLHLYRRQPFYGLISAAAFLFSPKIDDSVIYGTIALLAVAFYKLCFEKRPHYAIFTSFLFDLFSSGVLLYKISWGVPCLFTIILLAVLSLFLKDLLLLKFSALSMLFLLLFTFVFYRALTSGSPDDFISFLTHSYEQTMLYSQIMSRPLNHPGVMGIAVILSASIVALFIFYRPARIPLLIALPSILMGFKSGFVRADQHVFHFFNSSALILLSVPLLTAGKCPHDFFIVNRRRKESLLQKLMFTRIPLPARVLTLTLLLSVMSHRIIFSCYGFDLRRNGTILTKYIRYGIDGYVAEKIRESDASLALISSCIGTDIKTAVKGNKLVSIPWALAVPDALEAKPLFFPSLQFYSGYTEKLDMANLEYFRALEKKSLLLMQCVSIDKRHFLHDCPRSMEWILANYRVANDDGNWSLLKKTDTRTEVIAGEPVLAGRGLKIVLPAEPAVPEQHFLRLIVKDLTRVRYRIRTFLLRGPRVYLELELSNGQILKFRTFPEFLRRGVWISPFLRDRHDLRAWTEGRSQSLPAVVKVNIMEEPGPVSYLNPMPNVYIQECSMIEIGR